VGVGLIELCAQRRDQAADELIPIAEVDVERLARQRGPAHDLVNGHRMKRALAKQRIGRRENLTLRVLGFPPPARLPGCSHLR
jgi:hypothetical protein